jgi:hypothetical protein
LGGLDQHELDDWMLNWDADWRSCGALDRNGEIRSSGNMKDLQVHTAEIDAPVIEVCHRVHSWECSTRKGIAKRQAMPAGEDR